MNEMSIPRDARVVDLYRSKKEKPISESSPERFSLEFRVSEIPFDFHLISSTKLCNFDMHAFNKQ